MTTPRVLLVDADAETRTILRIALEHYGFRVSEASDADAALAAARTWLPDVVVSELWVSAPEGACILAARLRADDCDHHARVVVLTTRSQPGDLDAARRAGADRVYTKPVDLATLLADVRALAGGPGAAMAALGMPWAAALVDASGRAAALPGRLTVSA